MATDLSPMTPGPFFQENLRDLRRCWLWFVLLGLVLSALGIAALTYTLIAAVLATLVLGYFLLASGVLYIVGSFFTGAWGGFFLGLLAGVLYLATGFIVVNHPEEAAILYTLLLAVFFFVEGLFRIVAAIAGRFRQRGWVLFSGIVTLALGVMIWRQWPFDGLYIIGLFVGVNLIFSGVGYIMLGMSARQIPVH